MQELTYQEFAAQRTTRGLRLLDLREPHQRQQGYLPDTEFFPLSKMEIGVLPEEDDRNIALIASSPDRTDRAASILENAGFEDPIVITDDIQVVINAIKDFSSDTPHQAGSSSSLPQESGTTTTPRPNLKHPGT